MQIIHFYKFIKLLWGFGLYLTRSSTPGPLRLLKSREEMWGGNEEHFTIAGPW